MCAEAVVAMPPHRADYLLAARDDVFHILAANRIEPARMTDAASLQPDGT
jgi:hypothetical protein